MRFLMNAAAAAALGALGPAAPPVSDAAVVTAARAAAGTDTARVRLTLAPEGNRARYRIREQLAGLDLPNEAVGETSSLSGAIVLDAAGRVDPAASRIVVDAATLTSDKRSRG